MAVDRAFEERLRQELRTVLGGMHGPDPSWEDAPARLRVSVAPPAGTRALRRPTTLLMAAAIALGALSGVLAVGGGFPHTDEPQPGPSQGAVIAPPASPPVDPSLSLVSPSATSTPTATPLPCVTEWSSKGTVSGKGLVDGIRIDRMDTSDGTLFLIFGHPIDSVAAITIAPAAPPFKTTSGKVVAIRGTSFYRLSFRGLTKPTYPEDILPLSPNTHPGPGGVVATKPMVELRRLQAAPYARPVDGPKKDSTETWIIGLEAPTCLDVRTVIDSIDGNDQASANTVIIGFHPRPANAS